MLIQPSEPEINPVPYRTQPLWNDARIFTPSLGCAKCVDKDYLRWLECGLSPL